jgi:hypothetical protein
MDMMSLKLVFGLLLVPLAYPKPKPIPASYV